MVTQQEFDEATQRGEEMYRTRPHATSVHFDAAKRLITVDLNWGYSISFPPERSEYLHRATDQELSDVQISGVWGIYFPRLDADLWVPAMVQGRFGSDQWEKAWLEAHPENQAA